MRRWRGSRGPLLRLRVADGAGGSDAHGGTFGDARGVQPDPAASQDVNLFTTDPALGEAVDRGAARAQADSWRHSAPLAAAPETFERRGSPTRTRRKLKTFDTKGFRLDMVEFHPAYHE